MDGFEHCLFGSTRFWDWNSEQEERKKKKILVVPTQLDQIRAKLNIQVRTFKHTGIGRNTYKMGPRFMK